ncbi:MAG TPA: hypothetical protein VG408_11095 [Actinomycetota bacterium]|nr:hypothetical protein [Actinomycetota bacterium]
MRRRVPLGIAALAGGAMVLAHWIAYVIAVPDGHSRAHVLDSTGHDYWLYAAAVGLAAGVLGMGASIRTRLAEGRDVRGIGGRLAMMQVLGFLTLEMAERIASGHAWSEVLHEPVIAIGVVAQLVVALLGAVLLRGVVRVIARLRATRTAPTATATIRFLISDSISVPPVALAAGGLGLRGPPVRVR